MLAVTPVTATRHGRVTWHSKRLDSRSYSRQAACTSITGLGATFYVLSKMPSYIFARMRTLFYTSTCTPANMIIMSLVLTSFRHLGDTPEWSHMSEASPANPSDRTPTTTPSPYHYSCGPLCTLCTATYRRVPGAERSLRILDEGARNDGMRARYPQEPPHTATNCCGPVSDFASHAPVCYLVHDHPLG